MNATRRTYDGPVAHPDQMHDRAVPIDRALRRGGKDDREGKSARFGGVMPRLRDVEVRQRHHPCRIGGCPRTLRVLPGSARASGQPDAVRYEVVVAQAHPLFDWSGSGCDVDRFLPDLPEESAQMKSPISAAAMAVTICATRLLGRTDSNVVKPLLRGLRGENCCSHAWRTLGAWIEFTCPSQHLAIAPRSSWRWVRKMTILFKANGFRYSAMSIRIIRIRQVRRVRLWRQRQGDGLFMLAVMRQRLRIA